MENLVCKKLQQQGYDILFKSTRVKFNRIDFANAVDIVACKKINNSVVNGENKLFFIQVKTIKHKANALRQLYDFYNSYKIKGIYEAWLYDKKKNFHIVKVVEE